MKILKWNAATDGPLSEKSARRKLKTLGYSPTLQTYSPGAYFPPHTHEDDKVAVALSGKFEFTMDDESVILDEGDFVFVPKHVIHSAKVVGNDPVVSLDAVKI